MWSPSDGSIQCGCCLRSRAASANTWGPCAGQTGAGQPVPVPGDPVLSERQDSRGFGTSWLGSNSDLLAVLDTHYPFGPWFPTM